MWQNLIANLCKHLLVPSFWSSPRTSQSTPQWPLNCKFLHNILHIFHSLYLAVKETYPKCQIRNCYSSGLMARENITFKSFYIFKTYSNLFKTNQTILPQSHLKTSSSCLNILASFMFEIKYSCHIYWVWPLSSNSDHKDYSILSRSLNL